MPRFKPSALTALLSTGLILGAFGIWSCNALTSNDTRIPAISYKSLSISAVQGAAITPDTVVSTGGTVTGYSASPGLPAGLGVNAGSGLISGIPVSVTSLVFDTITATGPGGVSKVVLAISVADSSALQGSQVSPERRLFVNDAAANDSLISALAKSGSDSGGLIFVLQPGKNYHLRLATASTTDRLSLFGYADTGAVSLGSLNPSLVNDTEIFTLRSTQSQATWFAGTLQAPDGANAGQRISHVSLVSVDSVQSYSIRVNLIMVGNLAAAGLPDSAHKIAFADSFLSELGSVYRGANSAGFSPAITFTGTYAIAAPDSAVAVVGFGTNFVPLSGARMANAVNLYLVDSISVSGIGAGESVLGFSPREVVDLSTDEDSRVILSARGAVTVGGTSSITAGIPSLATTAAHEMGHFFGLRHPTATTVDLQSDDDLSNKDDGFASTPLCSELTKAGEHIVKAAYNKRAYCLYVAVAGCPSDCDITNLMFAYSCGTNPQGQRQLTGEQQIFFRRNLALLQGL